MNEMAEAPEVTPGDIRAAMQRLSGQVRRTPLERSAALGAQLAAEVFLKCECSQVTGSFKLRGALNCLLTLDRAARERGVVTASTGNHGLGVAEASARLGVRATIVLPATAAHAKVHALEQYQDRGVTVMQAGRDYAAAEAHGLTLAREREQTWISPYNDLAVIAGAGTVALEALDESPDADILVVPVGGGGLVSGVGVWARYARPGARVIGVQPEASPAWQAAMAAGRLVTVPVGDSLADGLLGNIEAGSITFSLAQRVVDEVVLVSEAEIAEAIRWLLREDKILVEGSAAVGVAALLAGHLGDLAGRQIVVVLTGRNISYESLHEVVAGG